MAVVGLGCDIIEIDRIRESCQSSPRFLEKIFTPREQEYCNSHSSKYQHYAGRFAAKEAIGKAIGVPLSWRDVEIISNAQGKPEVNLYGEAREIAGQYRITVSISHSRHNAVAVAVMEDL